MSNLVRGPLAAALLLAAGCASPKPYAILIVKDPQGIAAAAATIGFGEDLDDLTLADMQGHTLPFDFLVYATRATTATLWVDALDIDSRPLARGRVEVILERGVHRELSVELGYLCDRQWPASHRCAASADTAGGDYTGICLAVHHCQVSTCQDGVFDPNNAWAEECDDGNNSDQDGCRNDCRVSYCGDGFLNPAEESCDDGDANGTISTIMSYCNPDCTGKQFCGNGITEGSEACDDGAQNGDISTTGPICQRACDATQRCGDGVIEGTEACDDGAQNGTISTTETFCGPRCSSTQLCMNGRLEGSEGCDDANSTGGDGCSAGCLLEDFYGCDGLLSACFDTLYVDAAGDDGDGRSWAQPFRDLHAALAAAAVWGSQIEVWVAAGTYEATQVDPDGSFSLRDDTHLYGGFGGTEVARFQRDWRANESILSGSDVANHVVRAEDVGADAIIDGFVVTAGGDPGGGVDGSGMYNRNASPTIRNCTFRANNEPGMRNESSEPTVSGCAFTDNIGTGMLNNDSATLVTDSTFTGNGGGAMVNIYNSPTVIGCTLAGNQAARGAGIYNDYSSPTVIHSRFTDNVATSFGGGIYTTHGNPEVTGCIFTGNVAGAGAGMYNNDSFPEVTGSIFHGNTANTSGGAIAVLCSVSCQPTFVVNTILWNNSPNQITDDGLDPRLSATYNCVTGDFAGTGNIPACEPQFVDPNNGDYRLQPGSPCIDAGDNTAVPADSADLDADLDTTEPLPYDLDGNARFADDLGMANTGNGTPPIVDIGAFEVMPW